MSVFHLFGVRHHGPGCARSLVKALNALRPDCILIEGPPEGEAILVFAAHAEMEPPVALLAHCPDIPGLASYFPFAEFSPEWQAIQYGEKSGVPVRFMDLPCAVRFAHQTATSGPVPAVADVSESSEDQAETLWRDPLGALARAAGYADGDSWWNALIEERGDGEDLFAAIREAMVALREEAEMLDPGGRDSELETLREAHMRKIMRETEKQGYQRVAVVCGAWHVPALERAGAAKQDNALLKGLPKVKVEVSWVPWSNANLSRASGYGAGVAAPGWYEHLWRHPDRRAGLPAWLAKAARLFRAEDIDCSSAHIIEVARLAQSLAALRGRPQPGMGEINEALLSIVCMGDATPLKLIEQRLVIGDRLGVVPEAVPALPFQRDLEREQKRLRLKPESFHRKLDLDLRQETDLARSFF